MYRIGYKNTTTNKAQKMDLLVMENLFYQRNITHKFDLKGSIRNRLVNTSGKEVGTAGGGLDLFLNISELQLTLKKLFGRRQ